MKLGLLATLTLRVLYLARFGWDPLWVNAVYLAQARSLSIGPTKLWAGPIAVLTLAGLRALGLSGLAALEVLYLVGQLALTAGVIGMARALWPSMTRLRENALALLIATVPLASGYSGYADIGGLLGAALVAVTAAFAFSAATATALRKRELLIIPFALLAGATRTEALVTVAALALLCALFAKPLALAHGKRVAALLALGTIAGAATTAIAHRVLVGRFELSTPTYALYTFYAGLPPSLCDGRCVGEYGPYAESARLFGSFADNHGSLLVALGRHPLFLLARTVKKIVEWLPVLIDARYIGPIPMALAAVAVVAAIARKTLGRAWLLAAYFGATLVLLIPPAVPMYGVILLPPLLLAASVGAERLLRNAPRWLTFLVAGGALALGIWGAAGGYYPGPSIPAVVHPTATYLEEVCAHGCLVNYPPPHVTAEAWVDLGAGAPLPNRLQTDEAFIYGKFPKSFLENVGFHDRVVRARANGYLGPVLFLEVKTPSTPCYSDLGFDAEHDHEGPVNLAAATLKQTITLGTDTIKVWEFSQNETP